jgi:hypothetical protein
MHPPFTSKTAREYALKSAIARSKGSLIRKQVLVSAAHDAYLRQHGNASELIRQLLDEHVSKNTAISV